MTRASEWIFVTYFFYVALVACVLRPDIALRAALVAVALTCVIFVFSRVPYVPDWLALFYVLLAYREMNWFTPAAPDAHLERIWILWDRTLLHDWGLRALIESLGVILPAYLELCYVLVYAIGIFSIAAFYAMEKFERVDRFLIVYAAGTLLSYALFPFFPSDPPRVVFPGLDMPSIVTPVREFNLLLVGNYGIHSSVFPSAHVSSAFASAWGLMRFLPERPWVGRGMLIYAVSVSIATIYGRYHYAADALAGFVVALAALAAAYALPSPDR